MKLRHRVHNSDFQKRGDMTCHVEVTIRCISQSVQKIFNTFLESINMHRFRWVIAAAIMYVKASINGINIQKMD